MQVKEGEISKLRSDLTEQRSELQKEKSDAVAKEKKRGDDAVAREKKSAQSQVDSKEVQIKSLQKELADARTKKTVEAELAAPVTQDYLDWASEHSGFVYGLLFASNLFMFGIVLKLRYDSQKRSYAVVPLLEEAQEV